MQIDLDAIRRQLGEAIWQSRLAEARERESVVREVLASVEAGAHFAVAAEQRAPHVGVATVRRWTERWRADGLAGLIDRYVGVAKLREQDDHPQLSFGHALGAAVAPDPTVPRSRSARGRRALLLKWSGSKDAVVNGLVAMAPPRFERYHEPFLGGGSLFFALRPGRSFLSDLNAELINLYSVVREEPGLLLEALARHENTREHFQRVRGVHPESLQPVEGAARTLFLNRTCFNGLYRVNSKGIFNVPYGNQANSGFYLPEAIWRAHRDLAGAELSCADFEACAERARPGDFVYLDPPYPRGLRNEVFDPVAYQAGGFCEAEHRRVAALVRLLDQRGCLFMLSNSDCELTRELFTGFRIDTLSIRRQLGGHVDRRGIARELVVTNYEGARDVLPGIGPPQR